MIPNGKYASEGSAKRAANREQKMIWPGRLYRIFQCEHGWGFVWEGSANERDLWERGEFDAFSGPGSGLQAYFVTGLLGGSL